MKTINDLENGMVVKYSDGRVGMVYKGFMPHLYITFDGG